MHRFIPSSAAEAREMLAAIGVKSIDDLFRVIPNDIQLQKPLLIPGPLSEQEVEAHFDGLEAENRPPAAHFLGAGAYDHFIPSVVRSVLSRSEFYTSYTPYQPEVSQGTLQAMFEFQTMMSALMGTDLANASLYEGASATAEGAAMAMRITKKPRLLVARSVHPEYREVVRTYHREEAVTEVGWGENGTIDLAALQSEMERSADWAALIVQNPNFFGAIEPLDKIRALVGENGPKLVCAVNEPVSLGLLQSPGACGTDIVVGEAAGLGLPLSFGGPYVGFLGARKAFLRDMPGRLIGASMDKQGRRAFVIALATREQHIRRERATSNICTNQTLCALAVAVHLALLGPQGLASLAELNHRMASELLNTVLRAGAGKRRFAAPFFNEFVLDLKRPVHEVMASAEEADLVPGLALGRFYPELENSLLMCATEKSDPSRFGEWAKRLAEP